jgi:hypothetical protein
MQIERILINMDFIFNLASSDSPHFGQLIWAKLASAPFWPAVIFTEENQDWIRHKGRDFRRQTVCFLMN